MTHRAFCEDLSSATIVLTDSEAHHLQHVLRMTRGESVCLFDGRGHEAFVTITELSRRDVTCTVTSRRQVKRRERPTVTIAASPPKGDRLKWMVEKLTEIGVDRLILLQTARTILSPGETRLEKLQASVIAACKQSGRSCLMDVSSLVTLRSLLAEPTLCGDHTSVLMAHPGDSSQSISSSLINVPGHNSLVVLIGPEGGFTEDEVAMATDVGAIRISWPDTILRIETAAVVFAATLLSHPNCSWSTSAPAPA